MNKREEKYINYFILQIIEEKNTFHEELIGDEYTYITNIIEKLMDNGFIEIQFDDIRITKKGTEEKKNLEKELKLSGIYKKIMPQFKYLIDKLPVDDLYYF
ncbi:hypothetical protein ACP22Q_10245 [Staphylococcus epidermidis]